MTIHAPFTMILNAEAITQQSRNHGPRSKRNHERKHAIHAPRAITLAPLSIEGAARATPRLHVSAFLFWRERCARRVSDLWSSRQGTQSRLRTGRGPRRAPNPLTCVFVACGLYVAYRHAQIEVAP